MTVTAGDPERRDPAPVWVGASLAAEPDICHILNPKYKVTAGDPERRDPAAVWVGASLAAEPGPHLAEEEVCSETAERPGLDQQALRHPYATLNSHCHQHFPLPVYLNILPQLNLI